MGELKITTTGDKFAATLLYKLARNQMAELKHSMSYLGLQQNKLEKRPYEGVIISCHSFMGMDTVNIHVEPGAAVNQHVSEQYRITEEHFWYAFNASIYDGNKVFGYTGLLGLQTDSRGNVYVIGSAPTTDAISSGDPSVIKYDRNGRFIWRKMIAASTGFDAGTAIDIDAMTSGMMICWDEYNDSRIQNYDVGLSRYNYDESIAWKRIIQPSGGIDVTLYSRTICSVINNTDPEDPTNNSSAFGGIFYRYDCESYQAFLALFNYSGDVVWGKLLGEYDDVTPTCRELPIVSKVVIFGSNMYVVGDHVPDVLYPEGLLVKLDMNGDVVWKRSFQGREHQWNGIDGWYGDGIKFTDAAVDSDGNIYAIGFTHLFSADYYHVNIIKVSPDGELIWTRTVEGTTWTGYDPQSPLDYKCKLAITPSSVFVTFPAYDSPASMVVARLSKSDGADIWQRKITVPNMMINDIPLGGLFPKGISVLRGDIYLAADIYKEKLHVTMKLPSSGIPLGEHGYLYVSDPGMTFYSDITTMPYRDTPAAPNTEPGYYYSTFRSDFTLTVGDYAFTIVDPETGDSNTPDWNRTEKILRKFTKEKIN